MNMKNGKNQQVPQLSTDISATINHFRRQTELNQNHQPIRSLK